MSQLRYISLTICAFCTSLLVGCSLLLTDPAQSPTYAPLPVRSLPATTASPLTPPDTATLQPMDYTSHTPYPTSDAALTEFPASTPTATRTVTPFPTVTPSPISTPQAAAYVCQRPPDDYMRVSIREHVLNQRTVSMLLTAQQLYGGPHDFMLAITQGSYTPGLSASFGTHDGGGAVDLSVRDLGDWFHILYEDMDAIILALRQAGFAAWVRDEGALYAGSPIHIHAIAIGDADLSQAAQDQLALDGGHRGHVHPDELDPHGRAVRDGRADQDVLEAVCDGHREDPRELSARWGPGVDGLVAGVGREGQGEVLGVDVRVDPGVPAEGHREVVGVGDREVPHAEGVLLDAREVEHVLRAGGALPRAGVAVPGYLDLAYVLADLGLHERDECLIGVGYLTPGSSGTSI